MKPAEHQGGKRLARGESPRVKICGVTTPEDARIAVDLGAAFVGINFYPPSPRFVDAKRARRIRRAVPDCRLVGVFVDTPSDQVEQIADLAGLDLVQFHGQEPIEQTKEFAGRAIRALRPPAGSTGTEGRAEETATLCCELAQYRDFWGVLFDTPHATLLGGTGEEWDYGRIGASLEESKSSRSQRTFVAGGIRPDNVEKALRALPDVYAIDICSGVESAPGAKDRALMERLFSEVARCSVGFENRPQAGAHQGSETNPQERV